MCHLSISVIATQRRLLQPPQVIERLLRKNNRCRSWRCRWRSRGRAVDRCGGWCSFLCVALKSEQNQPKKKKEGSHEMRFNVDARSKCITAQTPPVFSQKCSHVDFAARSPGKAHAQ